MEETIEVKHLTLEAQDKMSYDDMFLVFPQVMMDTAFEGMSDMSDGLGRYLSPREMESLSSNNWRATELTEDLVFVMYSFDGDNEKDDVTLALTSMGLVDIRNGRKINEVTYGELVSKGFIICTKREINKLQDLVNESTNSIL